MNYFEVDVEPRELQYGRLVSAVLSTLQRAVRYRQDKGETRAQIAQTIGCDRGQLSRVLNGNVGNLTLRTISDILWASRFEPTRFSACAYEELSPNGHCMDGWETIVANTVTTTNAVGIAPALSQASVSANSGMHNFVVMNP